MASDMFYLLLVFCWTLVGYIFIMWGYGYNEVAYKYGKQVIVFIIGVALGVAV